jgi:hypothetical protein
MSTALAATLNRIPFQLFLTIRGDGMSVEQLKSVVVSFQGHIERHFKAPLTYVPVYESRPYLHCHMVIASAVRFEKWNYRAVAFVLQQLLGSNPNAFDLQRYDPDRGALPYILKTASDADGGDWDLVNCDLYQEFDPTNDRKTRKRRGRHLKRIARLMETKEQSY